LTAARARVERVGVALGEELFGQRRFGARYRAALHHAEVAAMPEPERELWLHRAHTECWSRNELRRRLNRHRSDQRQEIVTAVVMRFEVAPEEQQRRRRAAAATGDGGDHAPSCRKARRSAAVSRRPALTWSRTMRTSRSSETHAPQSCTSAVPSLDAVRT
jgi:hypothetical protein